MPAGPTQYRFPAPWLTRWLLGVPARSRRDVGLDGGTLLAANGARCRVEGSGYVPVDQPFVLVTNHFEREGMRVWWPAMFLSSILRELRGPDAPTIRWMVSVEFHGYHLGPVPIPDALMRWVLRLIADRYAAIPVPRDTSEASGRSAALRLARRALADGHPVGITPEAAEAADRPEVLAEPDENAALAVALLSRGKIPILPAAVFEEGDTLVARFGAPVTLDRRPPRAAGRDGTAGGAAEGATAPATTSAGATAPAVRDQLMHSIAALLPNDLRGPYATPANDRG